MKNELSGPFYRCIDDMNAVVDSGIWSLDAQVRIYDLLSLMMDDVYVGIVTEQQSDDFIRTYEKTKDKLDASYNQTNLLNEAKARLAPLERSCTDARFEAAAAASLHEFAKETFDIWQNSGVFMRRRALKALRKRAGFKLESNRIGNYVAKTFDLMNGAQVRYASAQQLLFSSNVIFKIQPDLHSRIISILTSNK